MWFSFPLKKKTKTNIEMCISVTHILSLRGLFDLIVVLKSNNSPRSTHSSMTHIFCFVYCSLFNLVALIKKIDVLRHCFYRLHSIYLFQYGRLADVHRVKFCIFVNRSIFEATSFVWRQWNKCVYIDIA